MSKEEDNKAVVVRWFTDFWGENVNLSVVDDIASPDMLLKYSLHEPRRGHDDIKAFMTDFRAAFPDLQFGATADLIAEGRLCRRPMGRRRHAHRPGVRRLPRWLAACRDRPEDAFHRHHGFEGRERQGRGGDRARRRRHGAHPTRPSQGRMIEVSRRPSFRAADRLR